MEENHSVISLENKIQFVYPVKALVPSIICIGSRKVVNYRVFPCRHEQKSEKKEHSGRKQGCIRKNENSTGKAVPEKKTKNSEKRKKSNRRTVHQ